MIKLSVTLAALVAALALPAAHGFGSKPAPSEAVAGTLLAHVNGGPAGRITRRVVCSPVRRASNAYACTLESLRSTKIGVRIVAVDGTLRTAWEPVKG